MSTSYVTRSPITLRKFKAEVKRLGWTLGKNEEGTPTFTDGTNYLHGLEEIKVDGKPHVMFDRYGRNDLSDVADHFDCASEHDDDYNEVFGVEEEE